MYSVPGELFRILEKGNEKVFPVQPNVLPGELIEPAGLLPTNT